ncbi:MAG TPA: hypothetical protein VGH16_18020 [Candidatus Binatia bacterium]|jgi:hypothetical protein
MQPFKIVSGYLPAIDRWPHHAEKCGFEQRIAFVMESYDPTRPDAFFDSQLYVGLVGAVFHVLGANRIRATTRMLRLGIRNRDREIEFHDADTMGKVFENVPEIEKEPFDYLFFFKDSTIIGVMVSEPWARVGGPELYHDSYTQALFTAADVSERVITAAEKYSTENGVEISEVCHLQGSATPTILGRVRRAFGTFRESKSKDKRRYGAIVLTADGFAVYKDGVVVMQVCLNDAVEIVAFKRDRFVVDLICFAFHTADSTFEVNEDMEGFPKLEERLRERLPTFDTQWYAKVFQPAFATNMTTIYRKAVTGEK